MRILAAGLIATLASGVASAQAGRRFEPASWKAIARFDDAPGRYLSKPQLMALCGDHVVIADAGDMHLAAIDLTGRPLWRYGREGSGPGEFRRIQNVSCDRAGRAWVYDPENGRVLVIGPDGTLAHAITIEKPEQAIVVSSDAARMYGATNRREDLVDIIGADGHVTGHFPTPAELLPLNILIREPQIAATDDGDVVMAFRWFGTVLRGDAGGRVVFKASGIMPRAMPEIKRKDLGNGNSAMFVDPRAPEVARQVAVAGRTVYVLVAGQPRQDDASVARIIDRFAVSDGKYLGSLQLPFAAEAVAIRGKNVFALVTEPIPALVILTR